MREGKTEAKKEGPAVHSLMGKWAARPVENTQHTRETDKQGAAVQTWRASWSCPSVGFLVFGKEHVLGEWSREVLQVRARSYRIPAPRSVPHMSWHSSLLSFGLPRWLRG